MTETTSSRSVNVVDPAVEDPGRDRRRGGSMARDPSPVSGPTDQKAGHVPRSRTVARRLSPGAHERLLDRNGTEDPDPRRGSSARMTRWCRDGPNTKAARERYLSRLAAEAA
jgi:hypothetical protein